MNLNYYKFTRFLFVFLWPSLCYCQELTLSRQYLFKEVGQQSANVFLEDSFGFIWIGGNTLYRYDGYSTQPYAPLKNDSSQTATGNVYALLEDSQNRIWIGSANGLFHYERAIDKLYHHPIEAVNNHSNKRDIFSLHQDKAGRLWIGGVQHLLVMEAPEVDEFQVVEGVEIEARWQERAGITAIVEKESGEIFAATTSGLWEVGPALSTKQHVPSAHPGAPAPSHILDAALGMGDSLWLATTEGLWVFHTGKKTFSKKELPAKAGKIIHQLLVDKDNEVWLGTKDIGLLKPEKGRYVPVPLRPDKPSSIFFDYIWALLFDRFGNLWVGTMAGIHRLNFEHQKFPFYQIDPGPHRYMNYTFRILQDSLGGLWFRLIQLGLGYSPGVGQELEVLLQPESHAEIEEIKHFCLDADGNVWVITLTNGLYKFERGRKDYEHIPLGNMMKEANALNILADRKDDRYLWFSSRLGLCRVDRFSHQAEWFDPKEDLPWLIAHFVGGIAQSENGRLWCSVRSERGVHIVSFDRVSNTFIAELGNLAHSSSTTNQRYYHLMPVPGNKVWVGSSNGVMVIDADNGNYERLIPGETIPLRKVLSITPDLKGNIWFTGDGNRICRFDGQNYDCYTAPGDIGHFNYNSVTLGKDGRVTFGGSNGIYSFYPDEIVFEQDTTKLKVYLTNFEVFNRKRHLGAAYEQVKEITLPFKDNVFTFEFAGLYFTRSESLEYRYKLEGFDEDWVETSSSERTATYTNLSPGDYTFKVLAANADSFEGTEQESLHVQLTILPPLHRTWGAYGFYVIAIAGLLFGIRRYELRRQLAKAKARQLKELDDFKSRFYTNITHEFRTPLTIINGMAGHLQGQASQSVEEGLQLIQRNGKQLLRLVNQLLDLSKLKSGKLELKQVQADIIPYLRYLFESFHSYAESRGIRLQFHAEPEELIMDYDLDQLLNIVSNLLSNAVKFTSEGGEVKMTVDRCQLPAARPGTPPNQHQTTNNYLSLAVQDTGIGIPKDKFPRIFDRFYRADDSPARKGEGVGVGLALTQELVHLMGGEIEVASTVGRGTTFTVLLPIRREAPPVSKLAPLDTDKLLPVAAGTTPPKPAPSTKADGEKPTALIVEDNADVVKYLISCLEEQYQPEIAYNGQEGIDKALELVPDIIITDVMMPKKDGLELCNTLKKDIRTSHIPIVMLTAKADIQSKISGLQQGADAYLTKPFHEEELLVRMDKLLELRRRLQEKYRHADFSAAPSAEAAVEQEPSLEDIFLQKFRQQVDEHLTDYDLDVSKLCRLMAMSRTQLYRKLKALTGMSANQFIRTVRLNKSKELLHDPNKTITEVAYDSGFSNPNYFSRVFSEVFGMSPTEYRNQERAE